MVKKIKMGVAALLSVAMLAGAPALASADTPSTRGDDNPHNKVTLCHATKSKSNPYVEISVNANGSVSGHAGSSHQNGQDIIPPFDYNDNGTTKHFPGQNWNSSGQAIFNNGCHAGGKGGGGGTTNTSTPVQNAQASAGSGAGAQQVAVAPTGGVSAGEGGGKVKDTAAVVGLVGSLGTLVSGVVLSRKLSS